MRSNLILPVIVFAAMLPLPAEGGEGVGVPPAGVLQTPLTVSSLYDGRSTMSGRPALADDVSPAIRTTQTPQPAPRAKHGPRTYVRTSSRPPASLPPKPAAAPVEARTTAPNAAAPASAPMPLYAPAAIEAAAPRERGLFSGSATSAATYTQPTAAPAQSSRWSFADIFMPSRRSDGGRGLFGN